MGFVSAHARGREIRLVDAHIDTHRENDKGLGGEVHGSTHSSCVLLHNFILGTAHGTEINAVHLTIYKSRKNLLRAL